MKKILSVMLGLTLILGVATASFAQEPDKKEKKKKAKKKKAEDKKPASN